MNLFAKPDHEHLVAPPDLFDREQLMDEHGAWGHQLLRAATAMETLAQITNRDATVLLKGGTLLQHSLAWPPYRASVDLDLETGDGDDLQAVLGQVEGAFSRSEIAVDVQETPLPGFVAYVDFPRTPGQEWSLRVDALEHDAWPSRSGPWTDIPAPWSDATPPQAAEAEVQAAQKLLMAADPPYGRDLGDHLGRQNFVKDLFDLRCLGHEHLEEQHLAEAAPEDIERKSGYLGESFDPQAILGQAEDTFRAFAPPPVNDDSLRGACGGPTTESRAPSGSPSPEPTSAPPPAAPTTSCRPSSATGRSQSVSIGGTRGAPSWRASPGKGGRRSRSSPSSRSRTGTGPPPGRWRRGRSSSRRMILSRSRPMGQGLRRDGWDRRHRVWLGPVHVLAGSAQAGSVSAFSENPQISGFH